MIKIYKEDPSRLVNLYSQLRPHFKHRLCNACTTCIKQGKLSLLLVAETEDRVVGISGVYLNDRQEESGFTVVIKGFEGKGLATRLLRERIKFMPTSISEVWEGNIASVELCKRVGLTVVGSRTIYSSRDLTNRRILILKKLS